MAICNQPVSPILGRTQKSSPRLFLPLVTQETPPEPVTTELLLKWAQQHRFNPILSEMLTTKGGRNTVRRVLGELSLEQWQTLLLRAGAEQLEILLEMVAQRAPEIVKAVFMKMPKTALSVASRRALLPYFA